ncbi:MAG: DUF115 domain-containing protein [Methanolinea sp.]|nr:DUF115 domain-containing protein [Methanolinea sp.]
MEFEEWEPTYREILDYFGFDRGEDERAAEVLQGLLSRDDLDLLEREISGKDVCVCGNAPCLARELPLVGGCVLAADAAALVLSSHGIRPTAIFSDLDGATDDFIGMNREGTIIVVHAHGDNIPLLRYWVPRFPGPLVGTTQARPIPHVHNFGGFTDGDRAVFAALALGAASITLAGFDFHDTRVDRVKRAKLLWAERLISRVLP